MPLSPPYNNLKKLFVGADILLPTINGKLCHYINFDNAASTPSLVPVRDGINSFLNYYSSVHRGTGALVGPRDFFMRGEPDTQGGGTVEIVTVDDVVWADLPERDEAGSPDVVGAVGLALASLG